MNFKTTAVFLLTTTLAIFFGFSTLWAGDRPFGPEKRQGPKITHSPRDRYAHAKPGKFHGPVAERRQIRQAGRIHHGLRTGKITGPEARRLKTQQHRIHRVFRHATADGRFNRYERRRIDRMQDRASRHIYRFKHNDFKRPRYFHPRSFARWPHIHPGWSRFSAGVWDSGWRFAFSVGGR